jgi:excisionase family DNA binding protein
MPRKRLRLEEAAEEYGISKRTLRRRISTGELKAYHFGTTGQQLWIDPVDLEKLFTPVRVVKS